MAWNYILDIRYVKKDMNPNFFSYKTVKKYEEEFFWQTNHLKTIVPSSDSIMKEFKAISAFLFWTLRRKFHAKHKIPSKEKIYTTEFNLMNVLAWLFENCIAHVLQMGSNVRSHSIVLKWMNAENISTDYSLYSWKVIW